MALIACKHEVYGVCLVPETYPDWYPDDWTAVDGPLAAVPASDGVFDPAAHPVSGDGQDGRPLGVLDYLAAVDDDTERGRVIDAERARGDAARKTVLNWTPPTTT